MECMLSLRLIMSVSLPDK